MDTKLLLVMLTLIENAKPNTFYTQKEITEFIYQKTLHKFNRKTIGGAISILENEMKFDVKNILGYEVIRGPNKKGVAFVKINKII